jgi:serine/threonine protein kinase
MIPFAKENYPLKADVYSYGITCAEILTGNIPFPWPKYRRADLLQVILKGERPPLPDECLTLLANLITRCWDRDPCKRPDFLQVCNELLDFKGQYDDLSPDYRQGTIPTLEQDQP